jgi:hypothetical protein
VVSVECSATSGRWCSSFVFMMCSEIIVEV